MNDQLLGLEQVWADYPFPSPFIFKVIAHAGSESLVTRLMAAAASILGEIDASQACIGERRSSQGKYRSLTLQLTVHSVGQIKALYQSLARQPGVLMVM
ncbi:MAG: DUF493 domain-containing protein [Deltaproteobacteria bacterium]|nr:DUF493 domain-containing protein [Deltaproteobacteria bacterium]MBW1952935.1 DUF493 domain-containing protein [Deltaproteobacteria bacterium]MBW1986443.1 DUF493 domain-containing protein [Deltaproteobacteria bacterium]MBW2133837.1 DUF493 domain-containing protein [Deltaproteobacteria bacterium]